MRQADKGVHFFTHYSELYVPVLGGDTEQWVFGCFSSLELIIATRETCDKLQEECGDNPHVHFMPLEMDRLYLFTNVRLNNGDDRKRTVVNVVKRFNVLRTAVDAYHVSDGLFLTDVPVKLCIQYGLITSVLLVRLGPSHSTPGSCMFFFRLFHLKVYAKPEKYSMIYTGHLIFDAEVGDNLQRWSVETPRVMMLFYNRMNEENAYAGEDAAEPNGGNAFVA